MELSIPIIISSIFVAIASGLISSFLILRRMSLISDALSHIALPGIALGIIFNFAPLLSGIIFLFIGIIIIWIIENKSKLSTESVTGVIFITALALGTLLMPEHELLETFFGNVEKITTQNAFYIIFIALIIILITLFKLKTFLLFSIAPQLATSIRISNKKTAFLMLILIALTISIGVSFVGVLLMSALLIIPGAASKNISTSFKEFLLLSVLFSVLSLLGGIFMSHYYPKIQTGIVTVLISFIIFMASFLFRKKISFLQEEKLF
jgi:ABC-type Mn2+/Zn2+ transport system permease subunit